MIIKKIEKHILVYLKKIKPFDTQQNVVGSYQRISVAAVVDFTGRRHNRE